MTDIDRINRLSESVAVLREKYKPYSATDVNLRLHSALGVAQDQLEYSAHILSQREPDPRQGTLLPDPNEGNPCKPPETQEEQGSWCDTCQNPKAVCTCPGRRR